MAQAARPHVRLSPPLHKEAPITELPAPPPPPPPAFPAASPPPLATSSAVDPTAGVVIVDLPCRQCGYNVRGLPPAGACPECGTRVALSLRGDLLRYSEPQWVRKLKRGVELILWEVVLTIFAVVAGGVAGFMGDLKGTAMIVAQLIGMAAAVVGFVGAWWLTEPDPSGLGEDRYGTVRKLIRITLLLGAAHALFEFILPWAGNMPPLVRMTTQGLNFVFQVAAAVGLLATLQYLRRLSVRIPDWDIAKRAHFLTWGFGVCYGVLIAVGVITLILVGGTAGGAIGTAAGGALMGVGCLGLFGALGMLVFGIMYLIMLINLRGRFAEQAVIAEQVWQAPQ